MCQPKENHQMHLPLAEITNTILNRHKVLKLKTSFSANPNIIKTITKPPDQHRRESSKTLTSVRFSNNNTSRKKRPNCAKTLKCMEHANSETHALTLTENISCKEKHISQATLWLRCATNSTERVFAPMENDASFCTPSMIWKKNYRMFKLWKKEADLPI
jgi:hypothetical protein